MTFKVYGPPGNEQAPPKKEPKSKAKASRSRSRVKKEDGDAGDAGNTGNNAVDGVVVSPSTVPSDSKPIVFQFENPVMYGDEEDADEEEKENKDLVFVPTGGRSRPIEFRFENFKMPSSLDFLQDRYYTHFVDEVATLLLIYDTSTNINPFRRCFPDLSQSSTSMASAMEALGALHLANTSTGQDRNSHFQHAMGKYGEVVKSFRTSYAIEQRTRLPDFATCLLLALFEVCLSVL